jgi:hypothetical protein
MEGLVSPMSLDLTTTWQLHRPVPNDVILLVLPEDRTKMGLPFPDPRLAFHISVNSYVLNKSMQWFARLASQHANSSDSIINRVHENEQAAVSIAHAGCPQHVPFLFVRLPLIEHGSEISGFTEREVRLFFSLADALYARTMSEDGAIYSERTRELAERRFQNLIAIAETAREHIIVLHQLACYFVCKRVLRWIDANLLECIDDDVASHLLDYVTFQSTKVAATGEVRSRLCIHDEGRTLYETALLWYHCLRMPTHSVPSELDAKFARLTSECGVPDPCAIQPLLPAPNTLQLGGAFVKCVACFDASVTPDPSTWGSVVVHAAIEHMTFGYWAIQLHEERCASGQRQFSVRHIGVDAVSAYYAQHHANVGGTRSIAESIDAALAASAFVATRGTTGAPPINYACRLALRFMRRDRHVSRAPDAAHYTSDEFHMAAPPDGAAKYAVCLPPHWREEDYHYGYCPRCKVRRRVAVLIYTLTIVCPAPTGLRITDDEPMPDAPPLMETVSA